MLLFFYYKTLKVSFPFAFTELTECPEVEFKEFPLRMKEWLFIVMKQLVSDIIRRKKKKKKKKKKD